MLFGIIFFYNDHNLVYFDQFYLCTLKGLKGLELRWLKLYIKVVD